MSRLIVISNRVTSPGDKAQAGGLAVALHGALKAVETALRRGNNLFRYVTPDDFGEPEAAFNFCTFWFIEALHLNGRTDEAREIFEEMLNRRTHAGLLSEDISLGDNELWGNYPQTYSLVGMINCAVLLSRSWTDAR